MRILLVCMATAVLWGCAAQKQSGSYLGLDGYMEDSRRWHSAEDKDLRFGRYSTHRYAATLTGVPTAPVTTPYGKTYY